MFSTSASTYLAPTTLITVTSALVAPSIQGSAADLADKTVGHKSDRSKSAKPKPDKGKQDKVKQKLPKQHSKHKPLSATVTIGRCGYTW